MQPGCEDMKHFQPSKSEDRIILLNLEEHLGMIAGVICGSLGLLSLLFAVLLCRRYNQVCTIVFQRFLNMILPMCRSRATTTTARNITTRAPESQLDLLIWEDGNPAWGMIAFTQYRYDCDDDPVMMIDDILMMI